MDIRTAFGAIVAFLTIFFSPAVLAEIEVIVSVPEQNMRVKVDGREQYVWPVSTGRGRMTPQGTYRPYWLDRHHRSSRYHNAPMPYSIFFNGNIAIHGTDQLSRLGRPVSHGCIRLDPKNAAILFGLVQEYGKTQTIITVRQ